MNIEKEIEKRKQCLFRNRYRCGIGTALTTHVFNNDIQNHDFVISWMLRCHGTMQEQGKTYEIHDECLTIRRPDREYHMEIPDTDGLRLYMNFPQQVYPTLLWMMPELETMEPVQTQPWNDGLIREFFAIYDRIESLSSTEIYTVFPQIIQYILRVTGIQTMRAANPLRQAKLLLEENNTMPLTDIAARCGMNYNTFRRKFTEHYEVSPHQYRIRYRIELAKNLLESGLSVKNTAEQLGYPDIYSFTHQFTALTGMPPSAYSRA
ncbi:MAG: helix-turn-helix transcriptional regulator [Clostridia bacterium]|nr:helix-turn-helix transcriptional regulator [Clostridia bacterium]